MMVSTGSGAVDDSFLPAEAAATTCKAFVVGGRRRVAAVGWGYYFTYYCCSGHKKLPKVTVVYFCKLSKSLPLHFPLW